MRKHAMINGTAATNPNAAEKKFWNMASVSDNEGEITLYGDVVSRQPIDWWTGEPKSGLYITPEGFMEDLALVKNKSKITVKLNSCGGDLYTGIAIHNALKSLSGSVEVIVEGIAASAASVIMCAGDTVSVYPGSIVMIHGVSSMLWDYYNITDLKQLVDSFDANERAIAEIYDAKTGLGVDTLRAMMSKETWMTGSEAKEKGFANNLLDGKELDMNMSSDKSILLVNGIQHDIKGFRNVPGSIPVKNLAAITNKLQGGKQVLNTIDELRTAYPELVAQIENNAKGAGTQEGVLAERNRIKAIEDIQAAVGDTQMLMDAKYGEKPCTAEELAFMAMKKQAGLGTQHLSNVASDAAASGAADVAAKPNSGNLTNNADDASEIAALVSIFNKTQNGGKNE